MVPDRKENLLSTPHSDTELQFWMLAGPHNIIPGRLTWVERLTAISISVSPIGYMPDVWRMWHQYLCPLQPSRRSARLHDYLFLLKSIGSLMRCHLIFWADCKLSIALKTTIVKYSSRNICRSRLWAQHRDRTSRFHLYVGLKPV